LKDHNDGWLVSMLVSLCSSSTVEFSDARRPMFTSLDRSSSPSRTRRLAEHMGDNATALSLRLWDDPQLYGGWVGHRLLVTYDWQVQRSRVSLWRHTVWNRQRMWNVRYAQLWLTLLS